MNKMVEVKCDVYKTKGFLGYKRGKHIQKLQRTREKQPGKRGRKINGNLKQIQFAKG